MGRIYGNTMRLRAFHVDGMEGIAIHYRRFKLCSKCRNFSSIDTEHLPECDSRTCICHWSDELCAADEMIMFDYDGVCALNIANLVFMFRFPSVERYETFVIEDCIQALPIIFYANHDPTHQAYV